MASLQDSVSGTFSSIIHQEKREIVWAFRGETEKKSMTGCLESRNSQVTTLRITPEQGSGCDLLRQYLVPK